MDIFYSTILDLLNALIPSGSTLSTELSSLNEILAYLIALMVLFNFLIKPVLKLFKLGK